MLHVTLAPVPQDDFNTRGGERSLPSSLSAQGVWWLVLRRRWWSTNQTGQVPLCLCFLQAPSHGSPVPPTPKACQTRAEWNEDPESDTGTVGAGAPASPPSEAPARAAPGVPPGGRSPAGVARTARTGTASSCAPQWGRLGLPALVCYHSAAADIFPRGPSGKRPAVKTRTARAASM